MSYKMIERKRDEWFASPDCPVSDLIKYIRDMCMMRDAQIDAIRTYLFLKIACNNRPLCELYASGAFNTYNIDDLEVTQSFRDAMRQRPGLAALYEYLDDQENDASPLMAIIKEHPGLVDPNAVFKEIMYGVEYSDYVFSLPMGAGKTYLMAAFVYIDLYFKSMDPTNAAFASNFVIFAPSGLKSSVVPSLRTIREFDPSWVIPEPAASTLRSRLKFELLDEPKTQGKSNKAKNPNVQKIASHQPFSGLSGLVVVTNAEKVILNNVATNDNGQLAFALRDENNNVCKAENELRHIIGRIPDFSIIIDEVHHAQREEIKLRAVVNNWVATGSSVNCVLGFSGTPYLPSKKKVDVGLGRGFKSSSLANVVHHYQLASAIGNFLKRPVIKIATGDSIHIVRYGVDEFLDSFGAKEYPDGTTAKLAIFCGSVSKLEDEILPVVSSRLLSRGINPAEAILKYHRGGTGKKKYPVSDSWQTEFAALDTPLSKKRIVLLAQIGKEGWDCKSLTGVILSQEGDCPKNMVLQTSCRCLIEVTKGVVDEGLIVLNQKNAEHLEKQLRDTQHIDLETFQKGKKKVCVSRHSRTKRLNIPKIEHVRFELSRAEIIEQPAEADIVAGLAGVVKCCEIDQIVETVEDLNFDGIRETTHVEAIRGSIPVSYRRWKNLLLSESGPCPESLLTFASANDESLRRIYEQATAEMGCSRVYRTDIDHVRLRSRIRSLFYPRKNVSVDIHQLSELAFASVVDDRKLVDIFGVPRNTFYPNEVRERQILESDTGKLSPEEENLVRQLEEQGFTEAAESIRSNKLGSEALNTFQYIPYRFDSPFERDFYEIMMGLPQIEKYGLELYYNGDKSVADFRIDCFQERGGSWRKIGWYTPDFLLVQRVGDQLKKVLIIETKGAGYSKEEHFLARKAFTEQVFVPKNNAFFHQERFRYGLFIDSLAKDDIRATAETLLDDFFSC